MQKLDMDSHSGGARGDRTRLRNQMTRLFGCSVTLIHKNASGFTRVSSFVADKHEFWWDVSRPDAPVLWDSAIQLGEQFFNEIIAHPVPIDLHILKAVKRSPLGLDLYPWLTYRTFTIKAPLRLSWKQLYRQFGAAPEKVETKSTVKSFQRAGLRELKKINHA